MSFCKKCGTELIEEDSRCPNCGYVETVPYNNVAEVVGPVKAKTGYMIAMWIFCILGGWIGILLASSVIGGKNPDKTYKYTEESRTQAKYALGTAIIFTIIYLVINLSS